MAPLVNPAVCATSSSDPSSIPRSAKTCSPASISSDLVSALRLARMIPMSIYDTDQHPNCNRPAQDGTFRYPTVSQSTDHRRAEPVAGRCDAADCAARLGRKRLGRAPPRPPVRSRPVSDEQTGAPTGGNLQFERAERATRAIGADCAVCKQPITTSYYEINGHVTCQRCRSRIIAERDRGTSGTRFAKALGLGLLAAAAGAGIYYAVAAATGSEYAIVAIVVGLLVGSAVRKGSNRRGGWRYQALAMSLTYSAIVVTYIPQIIKAVTERRASVINEGAPRADSVRVVPKQVGVGGVLLGLGALFLLAAALPILAGIGNIIGLFIIGIALYEAWRLNKAIPLRITGPYQVSAPPAASA